MALIFLHGFTNTGRSWRPVIAALGERYTALAPDIRGHGDASDRVPVTLQAVIGDVAELTADRFAVVGYSMGGRIALHVALALPERTERLVLVGASPGIADEAERAARREADERLADEFERLTIEQIAGRWETAAGSVLAGQPNSVRAMARKDRLSNTPRGLARALRGLGTGALPSLWDRLHELAPPVTVVVGQRDHKFLTIAEQMAESLPAVDVIAISGVGHAAHLEAPEAVAEAIAGP